jgi:hypothetical protein
VTHPFVQVVAMFQRFGMPLADVPRQLDPAAAAGRIGMMQEELSEYACAVGRGDLAAQADALVDLVVFALGTAAMQGLPFASLFDDVMRANMAKERGVTKRGLSIDLVKPAGWVGPRTMEILEGHGYVEDTEEEPVEHGPVGL